jgi:hypothetical protein
MFGWLNTAFDLSREMNVNINEVYDMNVIEFLNYISFLKAKRNYEKNR